MPIIIKDYTWEQTSSLIFVTIPLKGVTIRKVDLFSTPSYFKIHFAPYLCEVFLFDCVDVSCSKAEIVDFSIVLKLEKTNGDTWPQLESELADDKEAKKKLREEALNWKHDDEKKNEHEKNNLKQEMGRFGVKEQMSHEDNNRDTIESVKKAERDEATESLEKWKKHQSHLEKQMKIERNNQRNNQSQNFKTLKPHKQIVEIFDTPANNPASGDHSKVVSKVVCDETSTPPALHPIRKSATIHVTHTKRVFPTPTRQSQQHLEDEWLAKQADMKRILDVEDANLTAEEKNPVWLCNKGDKFFKAQDFKSAINAYSHAVRLNYRLPCIFSNRAACHLMLGNYMKCIEDASKALEYLKPAVDSNASSRCKAHIRRGTALVHVEMYIEGLKDYEVASTLVTDNAKILQDCENIRDKIQGSQA